MKITLFLGLTLCAGATLAQDLAATPAPTYGATDCKIGTLLPAPANGVQWRGKCKDGFADGAGVVEWRTAENEAMRLQATFARGQVVGEGKLRAGERFSYVGVLKDGMPDGEGYFKFPDGLQYEGGIRLMKREGKGTQIYPNGDVYQGAFRDDRENGPGRLSFALGGSIEGEFHDGRPGAGAKLTYAGSGRVVDLDTARRTPKPAVSTESLSFRGRADEPRLGTLMREVHTTSSIPLTGGWQTLTPPQQQELRDEYRALDPADEPPYPIDGPAALLKVVHMASTHYEEQGQLRLNVLVGADGVAKQVVRIGAFDGDVVRYVGGAVMAQRYKPALCHGTPCEMMYPFRVSIIKKLP